MSPAASPPASGPRILVTGWAGAGNIGDELLTRAVVASLRSLGATPVVASRAPDTTARLHDVDSVAWGPRGVGRWQAVDGVCVGPGGILQDSSSVWSLPAHLSAAFLARSRGVPVAAVGVGAEPLRRRSSGVLLRRALGDSPIVTRDEPSTEALVAAGLRPVTGADVVFGLDLPTVPTRDEIVVSVGGTVRRGSWRPAAGRVVVPPVAEIAGALDRLAATLECRVVLTRFRGARDADAAEALVGRLDADTEVLGADVDEHVRRVLGARLVVSSRYHPLVLAARAGVPAIAVSDQLKVASLVAQIDQPWVRRVDSWLAVGDVGPDLRGVAGGVTVPGLEHAHAALTALVEAAGAARSPRSGG